MRVPRCDSIFSVQPQFSLYTYAPGATLTTCRCFPSVVCSAKRPIDLLSILYLSILSSYKFYNSQSCRTWRRPQAACVGVNTQQSRKWVMWFCDRSSLAVPDDTEPNT